MRHTTTSNAVRAAAKPDASAASRTSSVVIPDAITATWVGCPTAASEMSTPTGAARRAAIRPRIARTAGTDTDDPALGAQRNAARLDRRSVRLQFAHDDAVAQLDGAM